MEVHHPKDVMHQKPWMEYALEFAMIFLAVFLGFLADNYRESRVEQQKAREYIEGLYNDLALDTARIQTYIAYDSEKLKAFTRLPECFTGGQFHEKNRPAMLDIIRHSSISRPYLITSRSLDQLSTTGSYRLLPEAVADSIINYTDKFESLHDFQTTIFQNTQDKIRARMTEVLSFNATVQMFDAGKGWTMESFPDSAVKVPLFVTHDKAQLNVYFNELMLYYRVIYYHRQYLYGLQETQKRLLVYLGEKYRLD